MTWPIQTHDTGFTLTIEISTPSGYTKISRNRPLHLSEKQAAALLLVACVAELAESRADNDLSRIAQAMVHEAGAIADAQKASKP